MATCARRDCRIDRLLAKALEFGQKAIKLDSDNTTAHMLLATVHQWSGRYEQAEAEADKVLALAPSDAETLANLGSYLRLSGRAE